ncbi:hypothetical protein Skr01_22960 [Sphaerisporangium krabiense]|uniref:Signal peptidase I n=1 Tax=Sphaerisporangium krabiense TaxID=763782 RepID=A0A7W8Z604_9ACTN|nr:S26 family signal peptidase [Sphaerisporangium krabiense]MBB5628046.1 signal peptidase I [Sphaerisporangium krabiense]GII62211.1 hypothetical protein Skr01_22960 [Sphaerisporangium krabiense]
MTREVLEPRLVFGDRLSRSSWPVRTVLLLTAVLLWFGAGMLFRAGTEWGAVAAGVPATGLSLFLLVSGLLGCRFVVVTVRGVSMEPAYSEGDRVLVRRGLPSRRGQVVVVRALVRGGDRRATLPDGTVVDGPSWMIKRVIAVAGDPVPRQVPALTRVAEDHVPQGRLVLLGDNARFSFDSRQVGYFPTESVLGTVIGSSSARSPSAGGGR